MNRADVVIVGGGVVGSAVAYHLASLRTDLDVLVLERDPTYRFASTMLSDGNVRAQFNLDENIAMSLYTMSLLDDFGEAMATATHRPDLHPKRQGNLFLVDEEGREASIHGLDRQRAFGAEVEWLDTADIAATYPPYAPRGLVGGTLGPLDGSVDPGAMLRGFRGRAIEQGARFEVGEAVGLDSGRLTLADGGIVHASTIVLAAGAWTSDLASTGGIEIPVVPVMRTVYVVEAAVPTAGLPSAFLPSGLYVIPESANTWLMAWSQPDDPEGYDFVPASRSRFDELIWPELVARLPAFDRLRVERSWAGLYAVNTLDGNALLGAWPGADGLYVACGFSGHGFQHAPAMGRHLAELIVGAPPSLDLSRLTPERVAERRPLFEHAGRII